MGDVLSLPGRSHSGPNKSPSSPESEETEEGGRKRRISRTLKTPSVIECEARLRREGRIKLMRWLLPTLLALGFGISRTPACKGSEPDAAEKGRHSRVR